MFASQLFFEATKLEGEAASAGARRSVDHTYTRMFLGMQWSRSAVPTQGLYRYGRRCGRHSLLLHRP